MNDYVQRILVVDNNDDYPHIRELLAQWVDTKFQVNRTTTYEAALAAMTAGQYDLYLIENDLGEASGLELLAEARQRGCQAPLILLTKEDNRSVDLAATQAGAADYLVKSELNAPRLERSIRYALERKRVSTERDTLLTTERTQRQFAEALSDITIALNSTLNLDELLARILANINRVVPHETADIMLLEAGLVRVVSSWGYSEHHHVPVQGMSFALDDFSTLQQMLKTGQPLVIKDTNQRAGWRNLPETGWVQSYLGAPIRVRESIVGFLNLASAVPDFFESVHADRLKAFADQAGVALGNAQLLEAERQQRELAEALQEVSTVLNSTLAFDAILEQLLEQIARVVPYDSGNVMLVDNDTIRAEYFRGYDRFGPAAVRAVESVSLKVAGTKNLHRLIETRQPLVISNTNAYPDWVQVEHLDHIRSWVGAPIVVEGEVIAIFSLDKSEPDFYQPRHAELLSLFAGQVAPALENAWSFEAEARRRHEAETLREATAALTSALDLDQVLENILLQLAQVVPYDSTCLFLKENEQLRAMAGRGLAKPHQVIGHSYPLDKDILFKEMQQTHRPIYLPDAQADPRFLRWGGATYIRGWLGVPLIARGEVIGHLTLDNHQYGAYGEAEAALAQAFANQAATAIENARLFRIAQQARQLSDTLREIGTSLTATLNPDEVLNRILDGLGQLVPYHSASVWLIEGEALHLRAGRGFSTDDKVGSLSFSLADNTLAAEMFNRKEALFVPDVRQESRWIKIKGDDHIRAWLGVPMFMRHKAVGFFSIDHSQPGFYTDHHIAIATNVAQQAVVAIENARLFEAERTAREQAENLKEKTRQNLVQFTRLYELSTEIVSALSLEAAANLVIEKVVQATGGHSAILNLLDQEGNLQLAIGPSESPPRPSGTTATIFETGQPVIISDTDAESGFFPTELQEMGIKASIGLPLKAGRQIIGALFVRFDHPRQFSQQELETLFIFANQAAIAIQKARLYEQVQQHATDLQEKVAERTFELRVMYELAQALGQATGVGDVIRLILLHLYQAIPYDLAACLLATDSTCRLVIQSQYQCSAGLEADIREITTVTLARLGNQACQAAKLDIHPIQPKRDQTIRPRLESLGSLLQVPITVEAAPLGVLLIGTQQAEKLGPEQASLLRTVADQAAESIQRLQLLLAAEHRRLEKLVAQLPDGVILLDPDRRIVLVNPKGQDFLSLTVGAIVGEPLAYLNEQPLEHLLTTESAGVLFEVAMTASPGYLFEVTAKPIDLEPQTGGWLLVIRDVTVERAAQQRIRQQEQLAAVGQLAAGIAHDFNNILTSIIGYAELLQLSPELSDSARQDLERITTQGHRAARLVRQILDFSRQSITEKRSLDLVTVLKEMIKLLERTIPENIEITLQIEPSAKEYTITADLSQIQQVLTNLAVNARDAMPGGGIMQFHLSHFKPERAGQPDHPDLSSGQWIVLSISDTGVGIPAKDQARIFEPFFTTKETGQGTGLGLAQVYGIITEHEGYIRVDSLPDKGTTFTCYLPARPAAKKISPPVGPTIIPRGQGELILLVEDDVAVLNTTKAMLVGLGYQVCASASSQEALALFDQHQSRIGLVLTDVTMPEMDGITLAQALIQRNPTINIVALTGYPVEISRQAETWQTKGIVDWLQKPVSLEQLGHTVSQFLNPLT